MRELNQIVGDVKRLTLGQPLRAEGISVWREAAGDLVLTVSGFQMEENAQILARMPQDIIDMAKRIQELETALSTCNDKLKP